MIIKTVVYKNGKKCWCAYCSGRQGDKSCKQKSSVLNEDFFTGLYQRVVRIDDNLQWQMHEHNRALTKSKQLLAVKEKEMEKHKQAIDRLYEMREEDNIDEQIQALKKEVENLNLVIQEQKDMPSIDKLRQQIKVFKERWRYIESVQERNRLLKRIVGKITYHQKIIMCTWGFNITDLYKLNLNVCLMTNSCNILYEYGRSFTLYMKFSC